VRIAGAEIDGRAPLDVRVNGGRIVEIAPRLEGAPDEPVLDARGGALLPGLHDHHLHLFALAAAEYSVRCGPPDVHTRDELELALRAAPEPELRGVGYHESVAGELDRAALDRLVADRPVRIQHRSGALWMLNTLALRELGLPETGNGRLFGSDRALRERRPASRFPSLRSVGQRLARMGVTGVTDATVSNGEPELGALVRALETGELCQRLVLMGSPELPAPAHPRAVRAAVKLVLRDSALPEFDALVARVGGAHSAGRAVAVHCVTRAELVLAVEAIAAAGARAGDRIEHASIAPPDTARRMAELGVTVVTQPGFLFERGDSYATDVDAADRPWLYRGRGLIEAGVPLGAGSDAPFGEPDPWRAMRSAVERRTRAGLCLGPDETLTPERALALFTSRAEAPGGAPRRLQPGAPADLCLLDRPWQSARTTLSAEHVRATLCDGELVWCRGPGPVPDELR
jgi:predicted amidohydrolase YtcJ